MPAHRTTWRASELQPDRRRLAEEDPGRVDAREAQAVTGALARLDGDAALNRQHGREEQRHPEDPGGGVAQRRLVRADGKRQQHEDEDGEGDDLPQPHAGARLDPQVLARHQHGVMPHGWPPGRAPTPAGPAVGTAVRVTRRPPGSSPVTRPPPMDTTRSARGTESSGSCDDNNTLAPSATASPISCPSSVREEASRPACGSSSSQSAGRRATNAASATRRRWPADSRPAGVVRRRPVRPRRSSAASALCAGSPRARTANWTFSAALSSS